MIKKKIISLLLLILISFGYYSNVYAEEISGGNNWNVEFTTNKEMVSNFSTGNFDDVLDYMQPGDTAYFQVQIKNAYSTKTDWYMTNKILQSLEDASSVAKGGGYTYFLTYTEADGDTIVLFNSDEVGGESYIDNLEGLHEATNGLTDFFYLDTLSQGQTGLIKLVVTLDGETQGNDYQDTLAQLQMNFAVELGSEIGGQDETQTKKETTIEYRQKEGDKIIIQEPDTIIKKPDIVNKKIIHTGDETNLLPFVIIALFLALLLIVLGIMGIKLRKELKNSAKGMLIMLAVGFIFANSMKVSASDYFSQDYTYTVRVFSGGQGTFSTGADVISMKVSPGMTIDLTQVLSQMSVRGKYYAKGIRESGKDNNTVNTIIGPVFSVNQDIDYVVAYAMNIGDTTYTVHFVDAVSGEELLPSQTYYGNVGEKTVVAYRYIDGYIPEAYNLAKTLVLDASENVLTFKYTKASTTTGYYINTDNGIVYVDIDGTTTYEYIPGQVIYIEGTESVVVVHDGNTERINANGNGNQGQNGNQNNNGTAEGTNTDNQPVDLIDLDDEQVALSSGIPEVPTVIDVLGNSSIASILSESSSVRGAFIIGSILLLIIVLLIIVLLYLDRKKRKEIMDKFVEEGNGKDN